MNYSPSKRFHITIYSKVINTAQKYKTSPLLQYSSPLNVFLVSVHFQTNDSYHLTNKIFPSFHGRKSQSHTVERRSILELEDLDPEPVLEDLDPEPVLLLTLWGLVSL